MPGQILTLSSNKNARVRHDAFLSYSHADASLARELERGLEKLAKPLLSLRALDVFRDETGLASSPALWPSIVEHLGSSEWFLLLASPQSAASQWCERETLWWLENRSVDRMLVLVTGGELVWSSDARDFDFDQSSALSRALKGRFSEEPLYTDLRWVRGEPNMSLENPRFRDAVLNVAAPLRGVPKDELDGVDVRQLRKNRRFVRALFASIAAAALLAAWQWRIAVTERDAAEAQARVAMSRKLVADSRLPEYSLDIALLVASEAYQISPTREAHENLIRIIHENDRFEQFLHGHESRITAMAVNRAGDRILVTGDEQGRSVLWKRTWDGARRPFRRVWSDSSAPPVPVTALRVSQEGNHVVIVHGDGQVRALRVSDLAGPANALPGCAASPKPEVVLNADGTRAAVRTEDGAVLLWDIGESGCSVALRLDRPIGRWFTLSPSGNLVAAAERGGIVTWWDASGRTGTVAPARERTSFEGFALRVSADDRRIASADLNHLAVWELGPGGTSRELLSTELESQFRSMAFSRDGNRLAIGMANGVVDLWRIGPGRPVREPLRGHRAGYHVVDVMFSDDGAVLMSGAEDGVIMLWHFGWSGRELVSRELRGHAHPVMTLTSDDYGTLVSSSARSAIVWDVLVTGGRPLLSYFGRNESVSSSYFDPVTQTTLSLPGILLRDADKDGCSLVAEARSAAGRKLSAEEIDAVIGGLRYTPTCPRPGR